MRKSEPRKRLLGLGVVGVATGLLVALSLGVPDGGCGGPMAPPSEGAGAKTATVRQAQIEGGNLSPAECGQCWIGPTTTHYEACSASTDDPTAQDNGPCFLPEDTVLTPANTPPPGHRLFVHGFGADPTSWDVWRTLANTANAGTSYVALAPDDDGNKSLLEQASNLADSINAGFAGVPDNSVTAYVHSMGAIKIEAVLELGWYQSVPSRVEDLDGNHSWGLQNRVENILDGHDFAAAARKIKRVEAFQGAHGGCGADLLQAMVVFPVPLAVGPLRAALDLGYVETNSHEWYWGENDIPGTRFGYLNAGVHAMGTTGSGLQWDLAKIIWSDSPNPKTIRYNRAFVHAGGPQCTGALSGTFNLTALVCNSSENDGTVRRSSMAPTWWANFSNLTSYITVRDLGPNYCHMVPFTGTQAFIEPKKDLNLANEVMSAESAPPIAPSGHRYLHAIAGGNYCDGQCFCAMHPGHSYCVSSSGNSGSGDVGDNRPRIEKQCTPTLANHFCGTQSADDACLCVVPQAAQSGGGLPLYNYTDPAYLACRAYVRLACMQAASAATIEKEGAVDSNDALKRGGYIVPKGSHGLAPVDATDAPKDGESACDPSIENKFCGSLTSDCFCNRPSDAFPECVAYVGQRRECEGEIVKMFTPRSEARSADPAEAEKSEK